jgi:hypothetical protein
VLVMACRPTASTRSGQPGCLLLTLLGVGLGTVARSRRHRGRCVRSLPPTRCPEPAAGVRAISLDDGPGPPDRAHRGRRWAGDQHHAGALESSLTARHRSEQQVRQWPTLARPGTPLTTTPATPGSPAALDDRAAADTALPRSRIRPMTALWIPAALARLIPACRWLARGGPDPAARGGVSTSGGWPDQGGCRCRRSRGSATRRACPGPNLSPTPAMPSGMTVTVSANSGHPGGFAVHDDGPGFRPTSSTRPSSCSRRRRPGRPTAPAAPQGRLTSCVIVTAHGGPWLSVPATPRCRWSPPTPPLEDGPSARTPTARDRV